MPPDGFLHSSELEHGEGPLLALPQAPAVFLIWARAGDPYLAKTSLLRRRALRLLAAREKPSRLFNLRSAFDRLEYWLTGSQLDASMRVYELARQHFPASYARTIRLRLPSYLRLLLNNDWPRTMVTARVSGGHALHYGPFRSRVAAEQFESEFLEFFQIRRCMEDLAPAADHPGCIYGEMRKCTRPCQLAVNREEYGNEVARASDFLRSGGRSLVRGIAAARDLLSSEMEFEEASRQHRRLEKVEEVLRLREGFAGSLDELHAVAVTRSATPNAADLSFLRSGHWQPPVRMDFDLEGGKPVSIDRKLREVWASIPDRTLVPREREERLAILARWFYSTWRDGELLTFPNFEEPPVRKLVNAIARVMQAGANASPV